MHVERVPTEYLCPSLFEENLIIAGIYLSTSPESGQQVAGNNKGFCPIIWGGLGWIWKNKPGMIVGYLSNPFSRSIVPLPKEKFWDEIPLKGVLHQP